MQEAARNAFGVLPTWAQVLTLLVTALVGAKLIEVVGYYALHQADRLAKGEYDSLIIEETHAALYISIFLGGIYLSAQFVPQVNYPALRRSPRRDSLVEEGALSSLVKPVSPCKARRDLHCRQVSMSEQRRHLVECPALD
ncbi:uncharacterized protein NP_1812A [Natronomonas pharaonis DSM 2160]|uniref:Uncharacterized protein n=1 Tax=Natronomonas pharaonis (strain ATCC 35678 / DSM 2160 / CIP 103997 / JCM 8858 / NBRC 14720 / NCIMB 2260 / Gabara) TaxID=348780 RepID=A0A1U7EVF0_NATPD|nr:hypothetical protein [Natronomonas pharaonis]CAI48997.1 uncharacterized protein NP_1812A [Natronomonas pharaonis DSM 2160]